MKRTRLDGTLLFYSCSLGSEVAETWERDSLLTDVLCDCIDRFNVLRVFDLLAIDAYRRLIDWQRVRDSSTDLLHCFDAIASGESALTSSQTEIGRVRLTKLLPVSSARAPSPPRPSE